jgi:tRNA (guanine-N(7)-)-methyltransferase subunit TRM82
VIKNFLFGHDEFVSQLYIPGYAPRVLVSGGGDDFVNVWKWHEGELIGSVRVREYVEEYLTKELHLPPARFRHEDSPKEISIARIVSLKNDEGVHLLLVLVENTPCVLVFDVNDDFSKVEYKQTVLAPGSIVDFTLAGSMIVASVESEDPVKFFSLQDDGKFKEVEGAKIADAIPFDVENELEFQHLYKYYQLRKRSDSAEAS